MSQEERLKRRAESSAEFDQTTKRSDGSRIVNSLSDGLSLVRDLFFTRVLEDVEQSLGRDSMLAPMSFLKSEKAAKAEIEIYLVVESAEHVGKKRYVEGPAGWFADWLLRLRMGQHATAQMVAERMARYVSLASEPRRLEFTKILERTLPDSRRAPLVIYRLMPLAAVVVTGVAFGDHASAMEARKKQIDLLPHISDCHACRGNPLENGERCQQCGNPMWKFDWLVAE